MTKVRRGRLREGTRSSDPGRVGHGVGVAKSTLLPTEGPRIEPSWLPVAASPNTLVGSVLAICPFCPALYTSDRVRLNAEPDIRGGDLPFAPVSSQS